MCFGSTEFWSLGEEPAIRGRNVYIINSVVKYIPTPAFMWNSFLIITLLFDQLVNASCMLTNIRFNPLHLIQNYRRPSRDERKINITHTNNWRGKKITKAGTRATWKRGPRKERKTGKASSWCCMRLNFEVGKWDDVIFKLQNGRGGGGGGTDASVNPCTLLLRS